MCLDAKEVLGWWTIDPLSIAPCAIASAVYARGVFLLWREAGVGHGIRRWEAALFALGQLALVVALVSPLDRLSDILFSAHMTQHEIIMIVAPPLIVLGRPAVALMWAVPKLRPLFALPKLVRVWRLATMPLVALVVHGVVVWVWHIPSLFEGALRSEAIHSVQHATFFASASLFWWSVLRGRYGRLGYGAAVAFVFATSMHTSILGALLTVTSDLWYPLYATRGAPFEVDAHGDQALAGLVMWIPAGTVLLLAGLGLFAAWLGEASRRVERAERRRARTS
jgi:putative membrane protein